MSLTHFKSPTQAVDVYGLDGNTVVRAKNMFFVRFRRADTGQLNSEWQKDFSYIVKSVDRPSVNPTVEEINQYNKKRQIHTGYKTSPVRLVVYDTIDNIAMRMWDEYVRYYFGDFNQDDDSSYRYDATLPEMADNGAGFGFTIRDSILNDSQFFFDALEVYQVFGGQFTQYDLINPRISQFDPDDLDYSINEGATISMQLNYEAIRYRNNGRPINVADSEIVSSVFNGKFNGNTPEVEAPARQPMPTGTLAQPAKVGGNFASNIGQTMRGVNPAATTGPTTGGGALAQFGSFNFGSVAKIAQSPYVQSALRGDTSYMSSTSRSVAAIADVSKQLGVTGGLSSGAVDTLSGAIQAASTNSKPYQERYIAQNVVPAILGAASKLGTAPADQVSKTGNGIGLTPEAVALANSQRSSTSQIGFNADTTVRPPNG